MGEGGRYWEIDTFRGVALLMMLIYHTLFDIAWLGISPVPVLQGFWRFFAIATAALFVLIAGVSLTLSLARASPPGVNQDCPYTPVLKRGATIFACGLLITAITWILLPGESVFFGILHLIGIAVMIGPLFLRYPRTLLPLGLAFVLAGFIVARVQGPVWLLWLGVHPTAFASLDYTPLLPWFGVFLIGASIGNRLYPRGVRRIPLAHHCPPGLLPISYIGRHTLLIYLIHQPVILAALLILTGQWDLITTVTSGSLLPGG